MSTGAVRGRRRSPGRCAAPWAPRRSGGRARSARPCRASRAGSRPGRRGSCRSACRAGRRRGTRSRGPCRPAGSWRARGRRGSRRRRRSRPRARRSRGRGSSPGAGPADRRSVLGGDRPLWRRPPHRHRGRGGGHQGRSPPGSARCAHRRPGWRRSEGCPALERASRGPPPPAPACAHPSSLLRPERSDPERILEAHVVALDPQPFEGFGQRLWVVERLAVVLPPVGCPDLRVVVRPDHHGVSREADGLAQVCRDEDPALAVELGVDGAGEDEPREAPGGLIGEWERGDLVESASQPAAVWIARQASSQRETTAPASSWARNFAGTAIRPLSSTVCRYSPVNTSRASPVVAVAVVACGTDMRLGPLALAVRRGSAGGSAGSVRSPLFTTSRHFGPY